MRVRPILFVFVLFALSIPAFPQADAQSVTVMPSTLEPGSPVIVRVENKNATAVSGEWLGEKLQFFHVRSDDVWYALAGADVEAPTGPSTLHITTHAGALTRTIEISPAHYRTGKLSVEPKFVEPDTEALKQITEEKKLKEQIFATSAVTPLWFGSFIAPVNAPPTDSFGTRRTFNGKLASIHKGMDFRVPTGTPVHAANAGTVVLAQPLYYEGNCVVIDHGLGLYTLSMHLSKIDVKQGQQVSAGEVIGLSGATGRVTGPHLHWAVRWQSAYLDPAKLLKLNLNDLR